jgi:hypothetical protein
MVTMANPSRRAVLRSGVVLVAASAPLVPAQQALSLAIRGMPTGLRRAAFKPHVGSKVTLAGADGTYAARLTKVADLAREKAGHDLRFRVLFSVRGARPEQGTFDVRVGAVTVARLFLTPIGGRGSLYEAVVSAG